MAKASDKVMEMVRKELKENPDAENQELYEKAKKVDDSVADLSLRQFHARYPLQVKRQLAQEQDGKKGGRKRKSRKKSRSGGRGGGSGSGADRDAIRGTLLQFAKDVSSAEGKAEMIDLLTSVDDYVDEVVQALDGGS